MSEINDSLNSAFVGSFNSLSELYASLVKYIESSDESDFDTFSEKVEAFDRKTLNLRNVIEYHVKEKAEMNEDGMVPVEPTDNGNLL